MTEVTFAELLTAIEQNTEQLANISRYPADNVQNLQNALYLIDRIADLSGQLADKVSADIADLMSDIADLTKRIEAL